MPVGGVPAFPALRRFGKDLAIPPDDSSFTPSCSGENNRGREELPEIDPHLDGGLTGFGKGFRPYYRTGSDLDLHKLVVGCHSYPHRSLSNPF